MKRQTLIAAAIAASAAILSGCAGYNYGPGAQQYPGYSAPGSTPGYATSAYVAYGYVDSIQLIQSGAPSSGVVGTSNEAVVGTVIGGVAGGVLGSQVGKGSGRTAATVAGAVGGAALGNVVGQRQSAASGYNVYEIRVRLDNNTYQAIRQNNVDNLRVGSRIRVENGVVYPTY